MQEVSHDDTLLQAAEDDEDQNEGGEKEETKVSSSSASDEAYPSHAWFLKWRETLLLGNIKVCI